MNKNHKTLTKTETKAGVEYLQNIDEKLGLLIMEFGVPNFNTSDNYFESLTRSIIFQQLSGKAASTIYKRFLNIYHSKKFPPPKLVAKTDIILFRQAGLSNRKASYIISLAEAFIRDNYIPKDVSILSNEQISEKLIAVKGIGHWTADMFLMFSLNRPDVFPLTDLGIQRGMKEFFNLKAIPSEKKMLKLSNKWKPYRSIASWYMWKIVDDGFQW